MTPQGKKESDYVLAWLGFNPWFPLVCGIRYFKRGEVAGESEGIKDQILAEEIGWASRA